MNAQTTNFESTVATPAHRADPLHRLLIAQVSQAGCFAPATARTVVYGVFILAIYGAAYASLLADPGPTVRALAILALAFISVHGGFIAHEAGHGAITRDRRLAACIGQLFNTFLTALSYAHFSQIHRVHHPHCNERALDPDMQSDVFSIFPEAADSKTGIAKLISRHQSVLIWVLVWLQGFTLKIDSVQHLRRHPAATRVDQAVLALHAALWFVPPVILLGFADALLNYILMTLLIGPYLGAIFLVNHIGNRVIEPGEAISFFRQEISVTRDLGQSRFSDFLFGGLNNHIEHHLFPAMPTAHLRAARRITRAFCHQHGIAYQEMSWWCAAGEVSRHFKAMSAFVPR